MPANLHPATESGARSAPPNSGKNDYDSPWKEALELFFPHAIALLAPDLHALIDWAAPVEFLDKELQAIQRVAAPASGRQLVDKLVKIQLLTGHAARLLIHIEVQGRLSSPDAIQAFSWRILQYKVLIQLREMRRHKTTIPSPIYNLGILIDQPHTAPDAPVLTQLRYQDQFLSQKTEFSFPVVELNQWSSRWDALDALAPTNPFAVMLMAQIQASGHPDKATRLGPLIDLVRRLYGYGYARDQISQLLRLVEWVIHLPPDLEPDYLHAAEQLAQEQIMSYVTIAERVYSQQALEKGLAQGREEGLEEGLEKGREQGQAELLLRQMQRRFGSVPDDIHQKIHTANSTQLSTWALNILDATTLDDVFQ